MQRVPKRGEQVMTITRHNAGIELSDIVGGYRVSELYIGYTLKEAKRLFVEKYGRE